MVISITFAIWVFFKRVGMLSRLLRVSSSQLKLCFNVIKNNILISDFWRVKCNRRWDSLQNAKTLCKEDRRRSSYPEAVRNRG